MDRVSDLRRYYSSWVGVRILPPIPFFEKYISFIFTFSYQPFQCLDRNDTFTSAITGFGKDTLAVGKTCDSRNETALFQVDGLICHPYQHSQTLCTSHL